jgi:hypothetical protein
MEAVKLAQREGVETTARTLRLDPTRLRARVGDADDSSATFVEVPVVAPQRGGAPLLVELVSRGGEQMRVHLAGPSSAALVELARVFWGR